MIPVHEVYNRIQTVGGKFFSVTFRRKHPKYSDERGEDGRRIVLEPAGAERHMVCRRRVRRYTLGVIPPEVRLREDLRNRVLTVFDVATFNQLRRQGYRLVTAGRQSYRRINVAEVVDISIPQLE
jgi:hypothetical protein